MDFFLLDTLKITIRIENLTRWWTQSGSFFVESRHFFQFSKREGEVFPLLPSCAPVSVAEYASISWICLNTLVNAWINCSDYAMALIMHDYLTCSTGFLRSEYGTVVYAGPNMSDYGFARLNNAWICLNAPEHGWILLSVPEYAWQYLNILFWLCEGLKYAAI